MKKQRYVTSRGIAVILIMIAIIISIAIISMNSGKMNISPKEVLDVIFGKGTDKNNLIVFEFRLPRIILAILVGIGMGASGCVMQSLLRNDMASPGTLGISSGSGFFVLLYIAIFSLERTSSALMLPVLAFIGGITAAILIFLLSYRRGKDISPTGLILTGVATSTGYSALTTLIMLKLDDRQMEFSQRWMAGDLWGADWQYIKIMFPWVLILFIYIFYKSRILNAINLGNQTATGLGVAIKREFLGLSFAAVALSSGSVALGGEFLFCRNDQSPCSSATCRT